MLKLFIAEQGSDKMLRFAESEDDRKKIVSALTGIEARSAISRLCKGNRMTSAESVMLLDTLAAEARRMIEQPVDRPVLEAASTLIDRHDLRALDAVQLGSAIVARELMSAVDMRLIASDRALLEAGRKEGFEVWNLRTNDLLSTALAPLCTSSFQMRLAPRLRTVPMRPK